MSLDQRPVTAAQIVDPTVRFIGQLLDQLRNGQLFIPRFQRGDVWDDDDRLELLNSVEMLIPIGSVMLWRTQINLPTRRRIGGHMLPSPPDQPPNTTRDYVLDGLQRLSTLLRALLPHEAEPQIDLIEDEDDEPSRPIYYDLKEKTFRVRSKEDVELWHLPTTVILYTVPLLAFQRKLSQSDLPERDDLIQRADRLANAFRTYKVPVVGLATNRLEDATQAFHRINSKGAAMSEVHMLNALTYTGGFDLERELEELSPILAAVGWETLDPKYLLATVRALCGLDVTQPNAEVLQGVIRKNPERIREAVTALAAAARLLKLHCCVQSPFWIPYAYQAVFLAYALRDPETHDDKSLAQRLARWFWRTSYTDYLRIGSRFQTQMNTMAELDQMRDGLLEEWRSTDGMRVETLPERVSFRTARTKVFALRLATQGPRNLHSGALFNVEAMLAQHQHEALSYIVSKSASNQQLYSSPENRLIYPPSEISFDRIIAQYLEAPSDETLASHVLDRECLDSLSQGEVRRFFTRRRRLLNEFEANFINSLGMTAVTRQSDTVDSLL